MALEHARRVRLRPYIVRCRCGVKLRMIATGPEDAASHAEKAGWHRRGRNMDCPTCHGKAGQ